MKGMNYNVWIYYIALAVAVLVGIFVGSNPTATTVLAVLGLAIGFLNVKAKDASAFLLATVALVIATTAANGLVSLTYVGAYIGPILANITTVVAPASIVLALKALNQAAK